MEFDVQLLLNGLIICYHDSDLKRIHGVDKKVVDLTIADLELYKIPTLDQILQGLEYNKEILIDIEVKIIEDIEDIDMNVDIDRNKEKVEQMYQSLIQLLNDWPQLRSQILITSFSSDFVERCLPSEYKIGFITYDHFDPTYISSLIDRGLSHLVVHKHLFFQQATLFLDQISMMVYTFFDTSETEKDDFELLNKIRDHPVGIITDSYKKVLE